VKKDNHRHIWQPGSKGLLSLQNMVGSDGCNAEDPYARSTLEKKQNDRKEVSQGKTKIKHHHQLNNQPS
jgi:hypothetical protein